MKAFCKIENKPVKLRIHIIFYRHNIREKVKFESGSEAAFVKYIFFSFDSNFDLYRFPKTLMNNFSCFYVNLNQLNLQIKNLLFAVISFFILT